MRRVRTGKYGFGELVYTIDEPYILEGGRFGKAVYYIEGKYIYKGRSSWGDVLYNIDGVRAEKSA